MPLKSSLHKDKLLSNISMKYANSEFIHDKVFPSVPVGKSTDKIRVYTRNFRIQETARADKGKARELQLEFSDTSYFLKKHALKEYIGQEEMQDNDIGDLRADTTEELMDHLMLRKESDFAGLFATSSNWSNSQSLAATAAWNINSTTAAPILNMDTATTTVLKQSGRKANAAIIPYDAMVAAKNHDSVVERIKYTSRDISEDMLAGLFGVPKIHVPSGQYDSSAEGVAESLTDIWAANVWVGHVAPKPGLKQVSAGYMLERKGQTRVAKRWVDHERNDAEAIEVQNDYVFRIIASLAGYLIEDVY